MRRKLDAPKPQGERRFSKDRLGWMLFVLCALCFVVSSLRNKDPFALAGSTIFLGACVVFLLPPARSNAERKPGERADDHIPEHGPQS